MNFPFNSKSISEGDFSLLRDLIHQRTGLFYENGKQELITSKLTPLLAEKGFDSLLDYYYFLRFDPAGEEEWEKLYAALAVNESYFWREVGQIEVVACKLVPHLQRHRPEQPVRIWHAGCAQGEEPYSMVIALLEAGRFIFGSIEIIATDFDRQALAQAREGVYRQRALRALPPELIKRYFQPCGDGSWRLHPQVRSRVCFSYLNLADAQAMARMQEFDIIFCRNVFIYFSDQMMRQVAEAFHRALRPDGLLFLGAVESLLRVTSVFELVDLEGVFAYRKKDGNYSR